MDKYQFPKFGCKVGRISDLFGDLWHKKGWLNKRCRQSRRGSITRTRGAREVETGDEPEARMRTVGREFRRKRMIIAATAIEECRAVVPLRRL